MTTMPANPTPAEGVVVPLEPTEAMIDAGLVAYEEPSEDEVTDVIALYRAMLSARPAAPTQSAAQTGEACRCSRCVNEAVAAEGGSGFDTRLMQMFLCTQCGNKRCPHATDHRLSCTNSNEAGQEGSSYGPPLYRRDQATLIEAQAAEIEGLRKAVEPFAKAGQLFDTGDYAMYDASIYRPAAGDDFSLHSGHLLAARRTFLASRTERSDG